MSNSYWDANSESGSGTAWVANEEPRSGTRSMGEAMDMAWKSLLWASGQKSSRERILEEYERSTMSVNDVWGNTVSKYAKGSLVFVDDPVVVNYTVHQLIKDKITSSS